VQQENVANYFTLGDKREVRQKEAAKATGRNVICDKEIFPESLTATLSNNCFLLI
jgi:hypothetical protein